MRFVVFAAVAACASSPRFTAGDTMVPTFAIGAQLQATKLERPERGRAIVFRFPKKPGKTYVKRIVGVAGDILAVDGTAVVLNGQPIPRCRLGAWGYEAQHGDLWLEAIPGARWLVFHDTNGVDDPPHGPWTVAPGQVFVLGDNRENSFDSRMWGGLPVEAIAGAVPDAVALPKGAEALQPELDRCIASLAAVQR